MELGKEKRENNTFSLKSFCNLELSTGCCWPKMSPGEEKERAARVSCFCQPFSCPLLWQLPWNQGGSAVGSYLFLVSATEWMKREVAGEGEFTSGHSPWPSVEKHLIKTLWKGCKIFIAIQEAIQEEVR